MPEQNLRSCCFGTHTHTHTLTHACENGEARIVAVPLCPLLIDNKKSQQSAFKGSAMMGALDEGLNW